MILFNRQYRALLLAMVAVGLVSAYSVTGKRIFRKNVTAASVASNISRRNVTPGVYMLSVNGAGKAYSARITHGGGTLTLIPKSGINQQHIITLHFSAATIGTQIWMREYASRNAKA